MKVLLAGCGDLGTETGLRFAAAGNRVLGLRRDPSPLPARITGQAVDLTRQRPRVPDDTDVVVIVLTADRRNAAGYRSIYVDGTTNVLDAVEAAGIEPRVLFVSSTAVYGDIDGEVDENTPTEPTSETGEVLLEAEHRLRERSPEATVLRLAGIYGPGRTALIDQVRDGTARADAVPHNTNRIHRDDAASAIVHLTTAVPDPAPLYVGVDHEPVDRAQLLRFLADELGAPQPAVDDSAPDRGPGKWCRGDRLRGTGFRFTYPTYREGYRAVLAGEGSRHP
ncbi:Nucleoside-diphosphate-sugar epimerase [Actinopolyspora xinjiangensis]|uniref:Nucleoside-diphosphate-sugar epimerase n=1 Tax=Actinopolyspora xinjiangensis TaxID=405564 RepID=A0A1H0S0Y8_9ACTN|nr:NAD-dependent epimerase/dehydratase family protein [Actinopolyspora xinjiangensis]SDP35229.1 Nucleoside-diphosphate-sugar epimerase [Actinopolyspora xinjiangensis]